MPVNVVTLGRTLGRPDSKFPAVPPQATGDQLLAQLTNNWGLVGGHISRAEAAWLLALATHQNATQALKDEIRTRASGVTIGSAATNAGFTTWLAEMGGPLPPPGPAPAPAPAGNGALQGALIPQDDKKVVQTASHEISFAANHGGQWLPDMQLKRRDIKDPEERPEIATPDLAGVRTAAAFKQVLDAQLQQHAAYLKPTKAALFDKLPDGDKSAYAVLNITGRRLEQFFNEMTRAVDRAGLPAAEAKEARKAINIAYRDAFRGNKAEFDRSDTGTYWSYGHDAAFVHVFEKMLEALPEGDPKRKFVQNQIDFIFENKYVPDGEVEEENIEDSLKLVAIDKASRHVVSMTPASDQSNSVRYEILQVKGGANDGKFAYRDGPQYFVEGTRTQLSDAEVQSLKRTPVETLTFRRMKDGEQLRRNFRYDWDGNRMINAKSIDTGWWGHCDTKALIETILADMKGSRGVTEFRSDTGKTTEFSRDMQLEALAAMLNFDDVYNAAQGWGGQRRFGQTNFAGSRNDDRPTTMKLALDRGGSMNLPIRLTELSEKGDSAKEVDVEKAFMAKKADEKNESFAPNPDVRVDPNTGDTNYLDASTRKIAGTTDGYSFDDRGRPVELKLAFEIDPAANQGDKVLIGTELRDIDGRKLDRFYYDPKTKEVSRVATSFVEENGKFVAKEGASSVIGKIRGVELGREMKAGDDVQGKLAMLEEAVRTGRKIATDSDTGMQVWNGEVHAIKRTTDWRSADGKWERESVYIDATFGQGKVGSFLHKLDDEGRIVESMELKAAVDFYWADNPRIAPLISDRGNWWVNAAMQDRGVIDLGAGKQASLQAVQDLNDLIYLGLKAKDGKKLFTIVHEGKRYVYEDEAAWKADTEKLKAGVQPGGGGGAPNQIVAERRPNLSIPDGDPAGVADALTVDRAGAIKDVKVDVDVKHTWIGDLDIVLVAPDGTNVKLHARGGRDKDDIVGTYGAGLNAVDDLKKLVGKDAKGEWKLKLVDLEGQDVGNLVSWGLKIDV